MQPTKKDPLKPVALLLVFVLILSMLPLYIISTYAHPSADDYSYGIKTSKIWEETHSIRAVLSATSEKTMDKYYRWQGNFTAIFLMYLQPGIFGEEYYILAPILLLTTFVLCSLFFYYTILNRIGKARKLLSFTASILIVLFSLQFTPVPSDSFYWYNGAIYYTFFYSLSQLLYGILIRLHFCQYTVCKYLLVLPACLLSFLIGGSNYSTALLQVILLSLTILFCLYQKNKTVWFYTIVFLFGLVSFCISIAGPGNMLRQETIGEPNSIIGSILLSFVYGAYSIGNATTTPILFFWFLLIPIFLQIIWHSNHSFRYPVPIFIISFCIYSAQITPVIFAQGIRIPYRIMNIVYFNYYPFVALNLFYLLGTWRKYMAPKELQRPLSYRLYYSVLCFAIIFSIFGSVEVREVEKGKISLSNLPFTASAVYSLINGEAKRYDWEAKERIQKLSNSKELDIELEPFQNKPHVLFHSDITKNPFYWKNIHLAQYYKKRSVKLKY